MAYKNPEDAAAYRKSEAYKQAQRKYKKSAKCKARDLRYSRSEKGVLANRRRHRKTFARGRTFIQEQKNKPCADCGNTFHYCAMDFDHVRGEKVLNFSKRFSAPIRILQAEVDKCDVVCSNCHRLREFKRGKRNGKAAWYADDKR